MTEQKTTPTASAIEKVKKGQPLDYSQATNRRAKAMVVREMLELRQGDIKRLSGGTLDAAQLISIAQLAVARNAKLADCTIESLFLACLEAAELGLLPSGVSGMAHLVPYFNGKKKVSEAKLIPDYKGLAHLARESGSVLSISTGVIYANQKFHIIEGLNERLEVEPLPPKTEPGEVIYAWALAKLPAPSTAEGYVTQWVVLTRAEVDKIRSKSRASESGPWVDWYEEMAKKSAVKRLAKLLPRKGRFAKALETEDRAEDGEFEIELNPAPPAKTRAEETLERLQEGEVVREPGEDGAETLPEPPPDVVLQGHRGTAPRKQA